MTAVAAQRPGVFVVGPNSFRRVTLIAIAGSGWRAF